MARPVCLFTGQWADLPIETLAKQAKEFGYDGMELAVWGDHFEVDRANAEDDYCKKHWEVLQDHGLGCYAISTHLVGQAVCDLIDERHKAILSEEIYGDGEPEGVRTRAAEEVKATARAARKFFDAAPDSVKSVLAATGRTVVNGFTGSSIWHLLYSFPPVSADALDAGYTDFAKRWGPILNEYKSHGVSFALEVHPTEIAFDITTTRRALAAIDHHPNFGINFDPSHLGYQRVDYVGFLREFGDRIFNVHMKDVWWSETGAEAGVFGGHANFGVDGRSWDFRSLGHGSVDFGAIIRQLNFANYRGPLTVEWEDPGMAREAGAAEASAFVRKVDFTSAAAAFDSAFEN